MTRRWKLKTNSAHILLVLITLILVKAEWVGGQGPEEQGPEEAAPADDSSHRTREYIGNDQIANYYYGSSAENDSLILEGVHRCLDNFQLITCVKMLLLTRINDVAGLMEESSIAQRDLHVLNGIFTLKAKNETTDSSSRETDEYLTLDEEIAVKIRKIFRKRSLLVNLLPKTKIEIEPSPESPQNGFLCFRYSIHKESGNTEEVEGRKRKKSSGMPMMMMVPQLIMLGLMPFTLASLKAMVMNAVMINMMALNGAIFMTIRNLVFGPRKGDNVKYVNYGYSKDRQTQSRRPVLIIHSPAAFVKQPPAHRHRYHSGSHAKQTFLLENDFSSEGSSLSYHRNANGVHEYEDRYHAVRGNDEFESQSGNGEAIQQRMEPTHGAGFNAAKSQTSNHIFNPNQRILSQKTGVKRYHKNENHASPFTPARTSQQSSQKNFYLRPQVQGTGSEDGEHFQSERNRI